MTKPTPALLVRALLGLALLLAPVSASAIEPIALDAALQRDVEKGEVLVFGIQGDEMNRGIAIAIIDAPLEELWKIVTDFPSMPRWSPATKSAEYVGTDGDAALCKGVTDVPWPMDDRTWILRVTHGKQKVEGHDSHVAEWRYVKGSGNMKDSYGYWYLRPWGDGSKTLVQYSVAVDLGVPLPDFLLTWARNRMLPNMLKGLRKRHKELYRKG